MEQLAVITALLGSLGVGTTIGQYVAGGRDRREVRSSALTALSAVELARFVPSPGTLHDAVRDLEAACLVARVSRVAVDRYTSSVYEMHRHCDLQDSGDDDIGFFINPSDEESNELDRLARVSAEDIVALLWSPWFARSRQALRRISRR